MSFKPVLLSLLLIGLIAGGLATVVILGVRSTRTDAVSTPAVHLWRDEKQDLWIETPIFIWNITGGETVAVLADGSARQWRPPNLVSGERVVDSLFLTSGLTQTLKSRVMFTLGDRTLVYVERDTLNGAEALELAFRAQDGLVRVTHAWLGDEVPDRVRKAADSLPNLEGRFVREMMEGLSAQDRVHLAANYSFLLHSGLGVGEEYSLALGEAEARRIGRAQASCTGDGSGNGEAVDPWARDGNEARASDPCQFVGFLVPGHILGSEYVLFSGEDAAALLRPVEMDREPMQRGLPDLDAAFVMRTPRFSYRAAKNGPAPGDKVTFVAHAINYGGQPTGSFDYVWSVDGAEVLSGTQPSLEAGDRVTTSLDWIWQSGSHTVTVQLDPQDAIAEVSERNNVLADRTDALAVGFWVEQSVYDYFNAHQIERGLGGVSWEDWAQRQLRVMNEMFTNAAYPLTPNGILDRVRLDKVTIVPDGELPSCATQYPDLADESVDLQWGFPAELIGTNVGHSCGELNYYFTQPDSQDVEYTLLHELSHVRYLVDLYGMSVDVRGAVLVRGVDRFGTTLSVDRDVDQDFPLPAALALEGELVICRSRSGRTLQDCERGAEGTTPRAHASGTPVRLAIVRLQDGNGNLVQGSDDLPVFGDMLYRNRYPDDLMSGGTVFQQHSAFALNRIAGQRPCCGNSLSPTNLGEYLNDLPDENIIQVRTADGGALQGARVEVYRARPFPVWYGKIYAEPPDEVVLTDDQGRAHLGHNPFSGGSPISHSFGYSNAVVLLKIVTDTDTMFRFLDVTEANEAYWSGNRTAAIYAVVMEE